MINLTPSDIIEHLFCPRFTYFQRMLHIAQHEGRHFKVQKGRAIHAQKTQVNPGYLRRKLGVTAKQSNQYLSNQTLRGEVDEVLFFARHQAAPLDYKFARYEGKTYDTYKYQLYCYAWLIEDNYGVEVSQGFLVYTRSRNHLVTIPIDQKAKALIKSTAEEIAQLVDKNIFPKATRSKKRCVNCTYKNICPQ